MVVNVGSAYIHKSILWFNNNLPFYCLRVSQTNQTRLTVFPCVSLRAVRRWGDVWHPLRVSWWGCTAPVCSCWMTSTARAQQLRWTQTSSAWGVSRSTSELCLLSSSRGRADANIPCQVFSRASTTAMCKMYWFKNWKIKAAVCEQNSMDTLFHTL